MRKALKSKKAEGYIDVVVSLLAIMMLVVLALNVFSFLVIKMDMDYFAREMVDVATTYGSTGCSEVRERQEQLEAEVGFSPKVTWDGTAYLRGTDVQYAETIQVHLSYSTEILGMGVVQAPITLTAAYSGLSQYYHK